MKRISVIGVTVLIFASAAFAQQSKPVSVNIPKGTQIMARLTSQLDSDQVKVGDQLTMDVLEDLKIENAIVVPRGAIIMGHVTEAKGARKMGRGGLLNIAFDTVTASDGTKVPVSGEDFAKGKGGYGGGSAAGAAAAGLFFPPAAALLLLKHGHASVIAEGTILTVHVTADTLVAGTLQAPVIAVAQVAAVTPQISHPVDDGYANGSGSAQHPESLGDYARRMKAEKAAR